MIKLKVREKSLSFAAAKKCKTTLKEQDLEKRIAFLERELENSSTSAIQRLSLAEQLESCKSELEQIIGWRFTLPDEIQYHQLVNFSARKQHCTEPR